MGRLAAQLDLSGKDGAIVSVFARLRDGNLSVFREFNGPQLFSLTLSQNDEFSVDDSTGSFVLMKEGQKYHLGCPNKETHRAWVANLEDHITKVVVPPPIFPGSPDSDCAPHEGFQSEPESEGEASPMGKPASESDSPSLSDPGSESSTSDLERGGVYVEQASPQKQLAPTRISIPVVNEDITAPAALASSGSVISTGARRVPSRLINRLVADGKKGRPEVVRIESRTSGAHSPALDAHMDLMKTRMNELLSSDPALSAAIAAIGNGDDSEEEDVEEGGGLDDDAEGDDDSSTLASSFVLGNRLSPHNTSREDTGGDGDAVVGGGRTSAGGVVAAFPWTMGSSRDFAIPVEDTDEVLVHEPSSHMALGMGVGAQTAPPSSSSSLMFRSSLPRKNSSAGVQGPAMIPFSTKTHQSPEERKREHKAVADSMRESQHMEALARGVNDETSRADTEGLYSNCSGGGFTTEGTTVDVDSMVPAITGKPSSPPDKMRGAAKDQGKGGKRKSTGKRDLGADGTSTGLGSGSDPDTGFSTGAVHGKDAPRVAQGRGRSKERTRPVSQGTRSRQEQGWDTWFIKDSTLRKGKADVTTPRVPKPRETKPRGGSSLGSRPQGEKKYIGPVIGTGENEHKANQVISLRPKRQQSPPRKSPLPPAAKSKAHRYPPENARGRRQVYARNGGGYEIGTPAGGEENINGNGQGNDDDDNDAAYVATGYDSEGDSSQRLQPSGPLLKSSQSPPKENGSIRSKGKTASRSTSKAKDGKPLQQVISEDDSLSLSASHAESVTDTAEFIRLTKWLKQIGMDKWAGTLKKKGINKVSVVELLDMDDLLQCGMSTKEADKVMALVSSLNIRTPSASMDDHHLTDLLASFEKDPAISGKWDRGDTPLGQRGRSLPPLKRFSPNAHVFGSGTRLHFFLLVSFDEGKNKDFFGIWDQIVILSANSRAHGWMRSLQHVQQRNVLEFMLRIYFYTYPMVYQQDRSHQVDAGQHFRDYLKTLRSDSGVLKSKEYASYVAMAISPDPASNPAFAEIFQTSWRQSLRRRLEKFVEIVSLAIAGNGPSMDASGFRSTYSGAMPSPTMAARNVRMLIAPDSTGRRRSRTPNPPRGRMMDMGTGASNTSSPTHAQRMLQRSLSVDRGARRPILSSSAANYSNTHQVFAPSALASTMASWTSPNPQPRAATSMNMVRFDLAAFNDDDHVMTRSRNSTKSTEPVHVHLSSTSPAVLQNTKPKPLKERKLDLGSLRQEKKTAGNSSNDNNLASSDSNTGLVKPNPDQASREARMRMPSAAAFARRQPKPKPEPEPEAEPKNQPIATVPPRRSSGSLTLAAMLEKKKSTEMTAPQMRDTRETRETTRTRASLSRVASISEHAAHPSDGDAGVSDSTDSGSNDHGVRGEKTSEAKTTAAVPAAPAPMETQTPAKQMSVDVLRPKKQVPRGLTTPPRLGASRHSLLGNGTDSEAAAAALAAPAAPAAPVTEGTERKAPLGFVSTPPGQRMSAVGRMDFDAIMALGSGDLDDTRPDELLAMKEGGRRESFVRLLTELGLDESGREGGYLGRSSSQADRPPSTMLNLIDGELPVTPADLLLTGFNARDMYNAGYSAADLRDTEKKILSELRTMESPGLRTSLNELRPEQLLESGYSRNDLVAAGFHL